MNDFFVVEFPGIIETEEDLSVAKESLEDLKECLSGGGGDDDDGDNVACKLYLSKTYPPSLVEGVKQNVKYAVLDFEFSDDQAVTRAEITGFVESCIRFREMADFQCSVPEISDLDVKNLTKSFPPENFELYDQFLNTLNAKDSKNTAFPPPKFSHYSCPLNYWFANVIEKETTTSPTKGNGNSDQSQQLSSMMLLADDDDGDDDYKVFGE